MKKIRELLRPKSDKASKNREANASPSNNTEEGTVTRDTEYAPAKVWAPAADANQSPSATQPTAGARQEKELPRGKHALQLYSMATPNGQKAAIMLEELLDAGHSCEYDAWMINIIKGDQFGSEFTNMANPNSKIPALLDYGNDNLFEILCDSTALRTPVRVFESGSILLYLSEKFDNAFLPTYNRTEIISWLFWQVGSAPMVGGGFGHFYAFAKEKQEYPINRFTTEVKRQLDVLERQLSNQTHIVGNEFTLADIAIFPWYGGLVLGELPYGDAPTFLNVKKEYPNLMQWAKMMSERPGVKRGSIVNKTWGNAGQLVERHSPEDIIEALSKVEKK